MKFHLGGLSPLDTGTLEARVETQKQETGNAENPLHYMAHMEACSTHLGDF